MAIFVLHSNCPHKWIPDWKPSLMEVHTGNQKWKPVYSNSILTISFWSPESQWIDKQRIGFPSCYLDEFMWRVRKNGERFESAYFNGHWFVILTNQIKWIVYVWINSESLPISTTNETLVNMRFMLLIRSHYNIL